MKYYYVSYFEWHNVGYQSYIPRHICLDIHPLKWLLSFPTKIGFFSRGILRKNINIISWQVIDEEDYNLYKSNEK